MNRIVACCFLLSIACGETEDDAGPFTLVSPALDQVEGCSELNPAPCDVFPDENIGYMGHPDLSPELRWTGVPSGTQSFAITLRDLSFGQPHWVIWDVPGQSTQLPANVQKGTFTPAIPLGSRQASATYAPIVGYFGPQMPCNVYEFEIFALSLEKFSPTQPELGALVRTELEALGETVLGRATLTARSNYGLMCE